MAKRESIDLTFGDQTFKIRPLSMSQVVALGDLFGDKIEASQAARLHLAQKAVEIALKRDHGDVDVDDLDVDVTELPKQMLAIMRAGGFNPPEIATPAAAAD